MSTAEAAATSSAAATSTAATTSRAATTLVVLVHGHHGSPGDHQTLKGHVQVEFAAKARRVEVLVSSKNYGRTNAGVEEGGMNLAEEVIAKVAMMSSSSLPAEGGEKIRLAIVAHSLGGLYARAAIPTILKTKVVADSVVPASFTTMSTPHLGSIRPGFAQGLGTDVYLRASGRTGEDLGLRSDTLLTLCDGEHMAALARFPHRTLVATSDGDLTVPYSTASAQITNRYALYRTWSWWVSARTAAQFSIAGHSGFTAAQQSALGLNPGVAYEVPSVELELANRVEPGGWVSDTERMVRTKEGLVRAVCSPPAPEPAVQQNFWRRIDASFSAPTWSMIRVHDMPIGKIQFPPDRPACDAYMTTIARLVEFDTRA